MAVERERRGQALRFAVCAGKTLETGSRGRGTVAEEANPVERELGFQIEAAHIRMDKTYPLPHLRLLFVELFPAYREHLFRVVQTSDVNTRSRGRYE